MQDLRLAFRQLRAAPAVSAIVILSLALGIGANTAIALMVVVAVAGWLPARSAAALNPVEALRPNSTRPR